MKSLKPLGTAGGRLLSLAFSAPVEGAGPRYLMASTSGAEATLVLINWDTWLKSLWKSESLKDLTGQKEDHSHCTIDLA